MLKDLIRDHISRHGFITIPDYMRFCLLHPDYGYYTTQKVFGVEGDFTTAPETSQLFGEMIGVWAVVEWERLGKPSAFNLIELGPGRGMLIRDVLRATAHVHDFSKAVQLCFVEASTELRKQQKKQIADFGIPASWHEAVDTVPVDKPTIVIANEFFDALPIRQFIVVNGTWHERVIVNQDDGFAWSERPLDPDDENVQAQDLEDGTIYEEAKMAWSVFASLCDKIEKQSGSMLVIDYGDYVEPRFGDTLQSMKKHEFVDVLEAWNHADITVHVDFLTLETIAREYYLKTSFLMQREFLQMYGIGLRMERLCADQPVDTQAVIKAGYERLVDPAQMGHLFKVLVVQTP